MLERLARLGFASKGVVYLVLAVGAIRYAVGSDGPPAEPPEALAEMMGAADARLVVGVLALGLLFYSAWRFLEAFADANRCGSDARGLRTRAVYAISGTVYAVLAFDAARLALTRSTGGRRELPAMVLNSELARWMVVLVAIGLAGYGLAQLRRAVSASLSNQLSVHVVRHSLGEWAIRVSRIGIAGRALVLMLMGFVLGRRALVSVDSAIQTDNTDSLQLLAAFPTGGWAILAVGAGLGAYGVFQLVHARYRRIVPP